MVLSKVEQTGELLVVLGCRCFAAARPFRSTPSAKDMQVWEMLLVGVSEGELPRDLTSLVANACLACSPYMVIEAVALVHAKVRWYST